MPDPDLNAGLVREFVIASHSDFAKLKALPAEHPGLLENAQPDLAWKNWEGKTAMARSDEGMQRLLRQHGAKE